MDPQTTPQQQNEQLPPMPEQPASAPVTNQPASQPQLPPLGSTVMSLQPIANGQWQPAKVIPNVLDANRPLVMFGDGSQYYIDTVQYSSPIAATAAADPQMPVGFAANAATISSLRPEYEAFLRDIVQLYATAQALFQMPLHYVVTMAYRQAYRTQMDASGMMDIVGEQTLFVPDPATFERWITSYLEVVQTKETKQHGPEA